MYDEGDVDWWTKHPALPLTSHMQIKTHETLVLGSSLARN